MTPLRGLYPIVDLDTLAPRGLDPLVVADALLLAKPPLLQLRAKQQSPRVVLELLTQLKPRCALSGTLLFANDRPDLALLAGCDGVHIGQDDVPLAAVRRLSSSLQVGVSTHDLTQLERALAERPDYAAFGPIFATTSKRGADPALGVARIEEAAALARKAGVPLVVIGGLRLSIAPELAASGVTAAVISDLLADGVTSSAIAARAQAWQSALGA
jgi:thiamine-phosphate pyrophosphorylase